jgi:flagellar basal body rod protein FlgC
MPGVETFAGSPEDLCQKQAPHSTPQQDSRNEQKTSKEAGYGLAAQAEKMKLITTNFANFVTNERSNQAFALAAVAEEKLALDAANKIALQNITNQYLQLAKKFDDAMAKM